VKTTYTKDAAVAAQFIKDGGVVAFPTETVYGLGADVFNATAVAKIFAAKRRPGDNPLIAHIAGLEQVPTLTPEITETARKLIEAFFPGPLTIVLKKALSVPMMATAGLDTIGIRMPGYALAHQFLKHCGSPVAAPSANLSGRPSPTTWQAVAEDLDGRIDCVLQGDATEIGLESTVVDCTAGNAVILRAGSITIDQIRQVVREAIYLDPNHGAEIRSPGMRHQHYSPRARVVVVDNGRLFSADPSSAYIGINSPVADLESVLINPDVESYASRLFEFFRECDRRGIRTIYCERVDGTGIGTALMDRINRAASKI
jgi:L-threonylcarbamoyladenylate synthase